MEARKEATTVRSGGTFHVKRGEENQDPSLTRPGEPGTAAPEGAAAAGAAVAGTGSGEVPELKKFKTRAAPAPEKGGN